MKNIPIRTCALTREKLPKDELLRIVRNKNNEVFVDISQKAFGRGAYIKKELKVLAKARRKKTLEKSLKIKITEEVYQEIEKIING